jgi:hypothetical protein
MKKGFLGIVLGLTLAITLTIPALAQKWYAGNQYPCYGAKADIYTPGSAPYLGPDSTECSWISTSPYGAGYWIQTGWAYSGGSATSYTELKINGYYSYDPHGSQSWGTYKNYKIVSNTSNTWYAYIDNYLYVGVTSASLPYAPTVLQCFSEVLNSSTTTLNTYFNNVQYMDSGSVWHNFDTNYFYQDLPYHVGGSYYSYTTNGPY